MYSSRNRANGRGGLLLPVLDPKDNATASCAALSRRERTTSECGRLRRRRSRSVQSPLAAAPPPLAGGIEAEARGGGDTRGGPEARESRRTAEHSTKLNGASVKMGWGGRQVVMGLMEDSQFQWPQFLFRFEAAALHCPRKVRPF